MIISEYGIASSAIASSYRIIRSEDLSAFKYYWLQSKADAFEYADQVLEKWYPTVEEGSNKGIVVLVTSQKEGAITGGPSFIQAVGENILDAAVAENLPGNMHFNVPQFSSWSIFYTFPQFSVFQ